MPKHYHTAKQFKTMCGDFPPLDDGKKVVESTPRKSLSPY